MQSFITLFGNKGFADVIKLKRGHTEVGQALIQRLVRRGKFGPSNTHRHKGRCTWGAEAEVGAMWPQSMNRRSWKRREGPVPRAFGGSLALLTPGAGTSGLACEGVNVSCLAPPACGNLGQSPGARAQRPGALRRRCSLCPPVGASAPTCRQGSEKSCRESTFNRRAPASTDPAAA